jgi:hypothetical protein
MSCEKEMDLIKLCITHIIQRTILHYTIRHTTLHSYLDQHLGAHVALAIELFIVDASDVGCGVNTAEKLEELLHVAEN